VRLISLISESSKLHVRDPGRWLEGIHVPFLKRAHNILLIRKWFD
jgi:hypothetical protein